MTAFQFFTAAGWLLAAVLCLAVAALIAYGVIAYIRSDLHKKRQEYGIKPRTYKGR